MEEEEEEQGGRERPRAGKVLVMGPLAPPSWPKEELHSLGLPCRGGSSERGDSKGGSSFSFLDCLLKELRDNRVSRKKDMDI